MKKTRKILSTVVLSLGLLIALVITSVGIISLVPRRVGELESHNDERLALYFEASEAKRVITPNGDLRFIVEIKEIEERELVAKSKKLANENNFKRLVITFISLDESLQIVIDSEGNAYV